MLSDFYHIGSIIAVFLGLVIVFRKGKTLNNYILSLWLIVLGINIFLFHRLVDHQESFQLLATINLLLLTLQIPAPYIFANSFLEKKSRVIKRCLFHIGVPFVLLAAILLFAHPELLSNQNTTFPTDFFSILIIFYLIVSIPFYLVLALLEIKRLKSIALQQISDIYNNDFTIIRWFILGLMLAYLAFISILMLSLIFQGVPVATALGSAVVILSLSVMYAGVFGLQKSDLFVVHYVANRDVLSERKLPTDYKQLNEVVSILNACMKEKKPYLRPRLSLKELSEIALVPENQISAAINHVIKQNFYDYINSLRVDEFIERCKTKDRFEYTLTAIAFESGFNSKSTFFDIFKKHKGQTPLQYIKTL